MELSVQEDGQEKVPCPCGCGVAVPRHDGRITWEGGGAFYRMMLFDHGSEPVAWISIVARPPREGKDWMVTLCAVPDGVDIRDASESPITSLRFEGRRMDRKEVLADEGIADFYFGCADALFEQHESLAAFLGGGKA